MIYPVLKARLRSFRPSFRLRTLLAAVLAFNLVCAYEGWLAEQRRRRELLETESLDHLAHDIRSAAVVGIDDDGREVTIVVVDHSSLGAIENLSHVVVLNAFGISDDDLPLIARQTDLRELYINSDAVTDNGLAQLVGLNQLQALEIRSESVTGVGLIPVARQPGLRSLALSGSRFSERLLPDLQSQNARASITVSNPQPGASWTRQTESSAAMALHWIARQQGPDGSWNFQSTASRSPNQDPVAATSLALLPFLSAGLSSKSAGPFRDVVKRGINYLRSSPAPAAGGSQASSSLIATALKTVALVSDLQLTRDSSSIPVIGRSVKQIAAQQDPISGGWPGQPNQAADTVTTCRQLEALAAAQSVGLPVPRRTVTRARAFVDSLGLDKRLDAEPRPSLATVAGVYSGMILGWNYDHPIVQQCAARLAKSGPSQRDARMNLLGQRLMYFMNDRTWDIWNRSFRRQTVLTQRRFGSDLGDWFPAADGGDRLETTCCNCSALTIYHRFSGSMSNYHACPRLRLPEEIGPTTSVGWAAH